MHHSVARVALRRCSSRSATAHTHCLLHHDGQCVQGRVQAALLDEPELERAAMPGGQVIPLALECGDVRLEAGREALEREAYQEGVGLLRAA